MLKYFKSFTGSFLWIASLTLLTFQSIGQTTVTFPASGTWTPPAGVSSATVECWGAGGAGGGSTVTTVLGGGGGAGGSYARSIAAVTPGTAYTVTVGTGGVGATAIGSAGNPSWFNTTGTIYAQGGAGGAAPNGGTVAGGVGSSASSIGTTVYAGGSGANGTTALSGGGGGGAGSTGAGGTAVGATAGIGTTLNGGTGGAGDNTAASESNGLPGNTYGGGGSGAMVSDGTDHSGGSGANGYVTITYTCPTYSLTGTSGSSPVFQGNASTVTLTGSAAGLPVGTYTVTYNLSAPNAASGLTATLTVSTAGNGTFSTSTMANIGATTITITNLTSGTCSSAIAANNTSVVTVSAPPTYCASSATSTADEEILNVTFGTLNNSSTCATTGGAGSVLNMYSNYNAVAAPNVQQAATVAFSVEVGTCGGNYSNGVGIWIDYNQDGDFADAGELVYSSATTTTGAHTESGNIVIPITANLGTTAMRVICQESTIPSNPCASYSWGETEDYRINITIAPACSGVPPVATATATPNSICVPATSTLTVTGYPVASGITFQWQSASALAGPYSNIVGATSTSYVASPTVNTYYRCVVTCTNSGSSTPTVGVLVTVNGPVYATIPYSQSFEGPWLSSCDTREKPDNSWTNTPKTGDRSWRRDDDGIAAAWIAAASGIYTPVFSAGAHSARFHSYETSATGDLDLYVNLSPAGTKSLCFDYILNSFSSANMTVLLSTDGGATFPTTLLALTTANSWTSYSVAIPSTSATSVIRFRADGDFGSYDIGLDNMSISSPSIPNCATYTSPANGTTGISCGVNAILNWTAPAVTACNPATSYDVYFGTSATPPFIVNQTAVTYNPGALLTSTTYYWKIVPRNSAGPAIGCPTYSFTTGATFTGAQTIPPISDGFENCLDWTIVNGAAVNKWLLGNATSNGGTQSMYINNTGTNNNYSISTTTDVHFYKDITMPVGMSTSLSFDWKGLGESCCDYIRVYLAPTTYTPVAGTIVPAAYQLGPYIFNNQTTWQTQNFNLPGCGGTTMRLIFSWHNDGSAGTNPPGAIDNINIVAVTSTGQTCANPVNIILPYSGTGQSTACMNNDYSNASVSSCGTSFESGEDKVYKAVIGVAGCISVTISNANDNSIGFQVYNGCPDAAGTTCIGNYGGASAGALSGDISIPAPGTYYFIVDNFAGPANVNYDISISSVGGNAPNDPACGATSLTLGIAANGDNTCTNSTGEPASPACWTTGTLNTIWYMVIVPASGDVYIRTTAISLLNTQIAAYTSTNCASAAAFTYINCNDNAPVCGGGTSYQNSELLLNNVAAAGTTLYIRVDGANSTAGTFSIIAIDGNNGSPAWPPVPGQDCIASNPVCNPTMSVGNPGYFAWGNICDFPSTSTCLASGERSTVWYTININANGNLVFDIVPNDYGNPNPITGQANPGYAVSGDETDYDWALWKITGAGSTTCSAIAGGAAAVKCNYGGLGVTGLFGAVNGTAPAAYPGFGSAYVSEQPVINGEVYVLAISNFANDYVAGFSLVFGGTPAPPIALTATTTAVTWTGTSNTSWVQPGNWSNACSAPTCGISATIAAGGAQPILTANTSVNNLTINAGATLTINPGVILTVCGNFTNNGTLVADPTSTILFDNAAVTHTISGNVTGTNKFGHLTINKTGGSVLLAANLEIGGNFTTMNATSILNAANFYLKIGGNFSTASNVTLTNCPTIEFNGVIPQTFSNTAGTHALTNVVLNNTSSGLTLSGSASSNMVLSGGLTLTNGVLYTAATPILIMNAGSTSTSGSTVSFVDGPMRKIGNTAFVFPVGDAFNRWARIAMTAPTASSTFQAQYFFNAYTDITTMAAAPLPVLTYNVSAMEYWQCDRIAGTGNASLTLYWENAASSGINSCAALQGGDLVVARWNGSAWENRSNTIIGGITGSCVGSGAGTVTSDVLTAFSPFTFGSKSALVAVNPLPVELISFTGKNVETKNILEWVTGSETNNDYFTLERSINGYTFEDLSKLDGAGNSNSTLHYQYIDNNPFPGKNYYRLKQTDFDGYVKYASEIIALEYTPATEYSVYPNPASDEIFLLSSNLKEEIVNINITDISGKRVFEQNNASIKGNKNGTIINIDDFSSGIYYLTITDINGNRISQNRFVKTK